MHLSQLNTIFLVLVISLLFANHSYAQEQDSLLVNETQSDSITDKPDKGKKTFHIFKKKKDKVKPEQDINEGSDSEDQTDDNGTGKKKFKISDLFKSKNKEDSILSENEVQDSIHTDSSKTRKKNSFFKKNRGDSTDTISGATRPKRLFPGMWNKMNREEQDSLLRAWDSYDKKRYKDKRRYKYTRKDIDVALKLKQDRNIYEKHVYSKARNKPYKYRKKLITRMNSRYRRTMLFDRLDKSETAPLDSGSDIRRYQIVNNQYKRESKRETIRKNNIAVKYDKKEDRLRRRYELSDNEKMLLNKGKGMPITGPDLLIYNNALRKQEKFSEKLLKLRRKRSIALQNESMQKHMKEKSKMNKKRDNNRYSSLFGKKKKKKNEKYDSYEYPKRYDKK